MSSTTYSVSSAEENIHYQSQVRNLEPTEYAEFEFEDSNQDDLTERGQQHVPLLSSNDDSGDEESTLEDSMEQEQYKLPSEGGTIFSSFVKSPSSSSLFAVYTKQVSL